MFKQQFNKVKSVVEELTEKYKRRRENHETIHKNMASMTTFTASFIS